MIVQALYLFFQEIAVKVDGYDAADMRVLLDRAALAAARRNLADISLDHNERHHSTLPSGAQQTQHNRALPAPLMDVSTAESVSVGPADVETGVPIETNGENGWQVRVTKDDLSTALQGFSPAAYWGVGKLPGGGSGVQARPSSIHMEPFYRWHSSAFVNAREQSGLKRSIQNPPWIE